MAQDVENNDPLAQPELSFEEAFRRLEETALTLEAGNLTLDEATRLYEEGMNLAKLCNQHLNATQLKITQLRNTYSDQDVAPTLDEEDNLA